MHDMVENFLLIAMLICLVILIYPLTKHGYSEDKPLITHKIVYESYKGGPLP